MGREEEALDGVVHADGGRLVVDLGGQPLPPGGRGAPRRLAAGAGRGVHAAHGGVAVDRVGALGAAAAGTG